MSLRIVGEDLLSVGGQFTMNLMNFVQVCKNQVAKESVTVVFILRKITFQRCRLSFLWKKTRGDKSESSRKSK